MIAKHKYNDQQALEFFDDNIELIESRKEKAKRNYKFLFRVYQDSIQLISIDNFLNKLNKNEKVNYLTLGCNCLFNFLNVKNNGGKDVKVDLEGETILKADENDNQIGSSELVSLLNLSMILKDEEKSKWLADFNISKINIMNERDHVKIFVEYFLLLQHYFKKNVIEKKHSSTIIKIASEHFGESLNPPSVTSFPGPGMYMLFTQFKVFTSIVENNVMLFNEWLLNALEYHKEFWSQKRGLNKGESSLSDDPQGFLSWPLTALCSMAFDKGMKIEVESDYIPKDLYEGMFLKG